MFWTTAGTRSTATGTGRDLLDTNILLRFAKTTDPSFPVVDAALTALVGQGHTPCIVPQNVYEFWAAATRPVANNGLGLRVAECQHEVARLKRLVLFLPDLSPLFAEWESLVGTFQCSGKVAHDARLVAAMRTHGVTRLMTFNGADFTRYPGITVIDPAAVPVGPPPGP